MAGCLPETNGKDSWEGRLREVRKGAIVGSEMCKGWKVVHRSGKH